MAQVLQLKKATRRKAFLKAGITAPAGGGKTAGALLLAYGMMKEKYPELTDAELWNKVAIIDTENGSGELYVNSVIANTKIGEYNAITLTAPFTADKYISAIDMCEKGGMEVAIIDSTTHLWAGEGGLLEKQNVITAKSKSGNSYTAWREITPEHNHFVEKMLQCNMHVIATMRSKMEYVQEKDGDGNSKVRKLGLKPVQREGMEYEFTVFFDIDDNHTTVASKDRTGLRLKLVQI
jgi:AAA domain